MKTALKMLGALAFGYMVAGYIAITYIVYALGTFVEEDL